MGEELFNSGEEYLRFMRDNCEQCKVGSTIEYDCGDGENKTVYHCKIQREINDYVCEGVEPSLETLVVCDFFATKRGECQDKRPKI